VFETHNCRNLSKIKFNVDHLVDTSKFQHISTDETNPLNFTTNINVSKVWTQKSHKCVTQNFEELNKVKADALAENISSMVEITSFVKKESSKQLLDKQLLEEGRIKSESSLNNSRKESQLNTLSLPIQQKNFSRRGTGTLIFEKNNTLPKNLVLNAQIGEEPLKSDSNLDMKQIEVDINHSKNLEEHKIELD